MRITIIGCGYVGLVSGACFADFGHDVVCVDTDASKIASLQSGRIPIFEPGLEQLVAHNSAAGRLTFTTDLRAAMVRAEAVFLAVGTPAHHRDGHADLSYVKVAAHNVAEMLDGFTVVIIKSTVPVGTGDEIERIIRAARPDADVAVVSNPEFLREGAAIEDFKRPDRIVIGTENERAKAVMMEVYRPLHLNQGPLMFTERRTAELIKYASNAFLAMKITFINEIADLSEKIGADVQGVARGIGLDKRIGSKFLHAGPGFGGSCFPKDTLALIKTAREAGSPMRLIETTIDINDRRKLRMAEKIISAMGGSVAGMKIAVLGLAFKPNTDDMREAASLAIIPALKVAGAEVIAHDPIAMVRAREVLDASYAATPYDAAEGADAIVLLTEWDAYRALDMKRLKASMRSDVMVDLRNVYSPDRMRELGFRYVSVGRQ